MPYLQAGEKGLFPGRGKETIPHPVLLYPAGMGRVEIPAVSITIVLRILWSRRASNSLSLLSLKRSKRSFTLLSTPARDEVEPVERESEIFFRDIHLVAVTIGKVDLGHSIQEIGVCLEFVTALVHPALCCPQFHECRGNDCDRDNNPADNDQNVNGYVTHSGSPLGKTLCNIQIDLGQVSVHGDLVGACRIHRILLERVISICPSIAKSLVLIRVNVCNGQLEPASLRVVA